MKHCLVSLAISGLLMMPIAVHGDAGAGAGFGALGGALVGSLSGPHKNRVENSLIGAVAGGLLGYAIGNESEKQGRMVVNQALEVGPSYTTSTWVNPETSVAYVVTPQPPQVVLGRVCRDVTIQARMDGKKENLSGLTCRDEYGQWRLVDRTIAPTSIPTTQTVIVNRPVPVTRYVVTEPLYYPPSTSVVIYGDRGSKHYGRHHRHRHHHRHWD